MYDLKHIFGFLYSSIFVKSNYQSWSDSTFFGLFSHFKNRIQNSISKFERERGHLETTLNVHTTVADGNVH